MTIRKILRSDKEEHIQPFIDCILSGNAVLYLKALKERYQNQQINDQAYNRYLITIFFTSLICIRDYSLKRKPFLALWNELSEDIIPFFNIALNFKSQKQSTIDIGETITGDVENFPVDLQDEDSFFAYLDAICGESNLFEKEPYSEELINECIKFFLKTQHRLIISTLVSPELMAFFIHSTPSGEGWEIETYNRIKTVLFSKTAYSIGEIKKLKIEETPLLEWFLERPILKSDWKTLSSHIQKILSSQTLAATETLSNKVRVGGQSLLEWLILSSSNNTIGNWEKITCSNIGKIINCRNPKLINDFYTKSLKIENRDLFHYYIKPSWSAPNKKRALKIFNSTLGMDHKIAFYKDLISLQYFSYDDLNENASVITIQRTINSPQPERISSKKRVKKDPDQVSQNKKKAKMSELPSEEKTNPFQLDHRKTDDKAIVDILHFVYKIYINAYESDLLDLAKVRRQELAARILVFKHLVSKKSFQELIQKNTVLSPFFLSALEEIIPIFDVLILGINKNILPNIRFKGFSPCQYLGLCQARLKAVISQETKQSSAPSPSPTDGPSLISNMPQSFFANRIPEQLCNVMFDGQLCDVMFDEQYQRQYNNNQ